jgi:HSP20 family protein
MTDGKKTNAHALVGIGASAGGVNALNRFFDAMPSDSGVAPSFRSQVKWPKMPAVDVVESEKVYEITAELPGMDEKNIEVKVADGVLTIKGEKREETEKREKDYYLQERSFGSFERSFEVPESVEVDKIEASFKKGVLMLTLPKKAEAQKPAKKIEVKSG